MKNPSLPLLVLLDRWCARAVAILILSAQLYTSTPTLADSWGERLGFGADQKVVVLHAHEIGLCHATGAAAKQVFKSMPELSTGAMPVCPWFADFADWSSRHAEADVGLTLCLNSEWKHYRWQPTALDHLVPSLIDDEGYLWSTTTQTMVNGQIDEVEVELRSQIQRAKLAGLQPTHLTTHLGTLFTKLEFTEVYLRLAREFWIPAVVVELTPAHVERFRRLGYPIPEELAAVLDDYPLPKLDDLQFVPSADSYEAKKKNLADVVGGLAPGLTQLAFHPAVESDELKSITPNWQQRVWDAQLLADPEFRAMLQQHQVRVTDWREIMQRFSGQLPEADALDGPAGVSKR